MDPNTSTRLEHTNQLIYGSVQDDASPKYAKLVDNHKALLDALAHHEAMAPNLYQTYTTPAANKNKVYFEWDFVGRTLVSVSSLSRTPSSTQHAIRPLALGLSRPEANNLPFFRI